MHGDELCCPPSAAAFCAFAHWISCQRDLALEERAVAAAACILPHIRFATMRATSVVNYWHAYRWFRCAETVIAAWVGAAAGVLVYVHGKSTALNRLHCRLGSMLWGTPHALLSRPLLAERGTRTEWCLSRHISPSLSHQQQPSAHPLSVRQTRCQLCWRDASRAPLCRLSWSASLRQAPRFSDTS